MKIFYLYDFVNIKETKNRKIIRQTHYTQSANMHREMKQGFSESSRKMRAVVKEIIIIKQEMKTIREK